MNYKNYGTNPSPKTPPPPIPGSVKTYILVVLTTIKDYDKYKKDIYRIKSTTYRNADFIASVFVQNRYKDKCTIDYELYELEDFEEVKID
jgi:hypothetical protein